MSSRRPVIVIFGAAVWPGGRPSPSLARRIAYAAKAADADPDALILCSGAAARGEPSEASVMARVLREQGLHPRRLVLDEASRDTLQSAAAAARLVRREGAGACIVCSDAYHLPRIRLLLGALGVRTRAGPTLPGHGGAGWAHWLFMTARELAAIPYDLVLALARRPALLREPAG